MVCENCTKEHDGSYGSGRFCCKSCAISFGNKHRNMDRTIVNKKISDGVKRHNQLKEYHYICEKCNNEFITSSKIKTNRRIHCEFCKRKVEHYKNINEITSITDLSKRTISKILKRANKECTLCGWNESTCDIHHIIPKSQGGTNEHNNLIIVCPNCHRIIHTTNKYTIEYLKERSIENKFKDWKEFYHPSN